MNTNNKKKNFLQKREKVNICLSCGGELSGRKRRYCASDCKDRLVFSLRWLSNFFRALQAKYATFSFNENWLIIHVKIVRSKEILTFLYKRTHDHSPAKDLRDLVMVLSQDWVMENRRTNCRQSASLHVLEKAETGMISPDAIRPQTKKNVARVMKQVKCLKISEKSIMHGDCLQAVKSAFRRQAIKHHPDHGGDSKLFREIADAYNDITLWLKNPSFTVRRGVSIGWSYDGERRKWFAPL